MAKKNFSGGLNSLLGEPQQSEEVGQAGTKAPKKKLLRLRN
jgi:hypothetical protein